MNINLFDNQIKSSQSIGLKSESIYWSESKLRNVDINAIKKGIKIEGSNWAE